MTKISYIGRIPADELADRSKLVSRGAFVPFASMTEGETRLFLLADQARLLGEYYQDPVFLKGQQMALDAIRNGLHSGAGIGSFGPIEPELYPIAEAIRWARGRAAGGGIHGDLSPVLSESECLQKANKRFSPLKEKDANKAYFNACVLVQDIQKIYNQNLPDGSHYACYKWLGDNAQYPTRVEIKRLAHKAGVIGLRKAAQIIEYPELSASITDANISLWMQTCIRRKNALSGLEPFDAGQVCSILAGLPPEIPASQQKWRDGIRGLSPDQIVKIVTTVCVAATTIVTALVSRSQAKKASAFNDSDFGGSAYTPMPQDWDGDGIPDSPTPNGAPPTTASNNNLLLLGAAAAGLLLLNDKKS